MIGHGNKMNIYQIIISVIDRAVTELDTNDGVFVVVFYSEDSLGQYSLSKPTCKYVQCHMFPLTGVSVSVYLKQKCRPMRLK